ncbi:hypothetical protein BO70DRAFT_387359 [Aspergillus heteromorphus CBS 117.55]|uniref:Peptidase S54 rhomboid domain-containing protein n=1 Tax=Aspergillus heteromorphus CBS 117.55 TaxID=1448321 RepID=A0A317W7Y8_9EURO|nr:uncharacterized protein BO70DRAFT_387359 [Aspergillus heteromorphus CBS 117.55]PWY81801.1 hypothetical protein BO70DRAFT_387359 [Aspergillus heteromorphus CBS 117.55]
MSNAFGVAWRIPCPGLRASSLLPSVLPPSRPHSILVSRRLLGSLSTPVLPASRLPRPQFLFPFSTACVRFFNSSAPLRSHPSQPDPHPPEDQEQEHGTHPRSRPFSATELKAIFGPRTPISKLMGNRILAVMQGRRLQGTLDLDLPADITSSVQQHSLDAALQYLRKQYPMDEDAAIMTRIEREEVDPDRYKPQSGSYGAELGESNDPSGKSVLQQIRKRNETRLLAEQEKRNKEWMEGAQRDHDKMKRLVATNTALQTYEGTSAVQLRPRADLRERPALAWVQKHYLRAEEDFDVSKIASKSRRILPSLAFTLLTLSLCCAFAVYYEPCVPADRMWPEMPRAAAAVLGLIGINVGVWILWKWPPFWRFFNRYFMLVASNPRVFSLVGNTFSHQQHRHLAWNALFLWIFGTRIHDDIGRGEFLGLYVASGTVGSFLSLTSSVLTGNWTTTTLGASGAVYGLLACWLTLHANEKFTINLNPKDWGIFPNDWDFVPKDWNLLPKDWAFIPDPWKDVFVARGWIILACLFTVEAANMALRRSTTINHWAHMGGYLTGTVWALARKDEKSQDGGGKGKGK